MVNNVVTKNHPHVKYENGENVARFSKYQYNIKNKLHIVAWNNNISNTKYRENHNHIIKTIDSTIKTKNINQNPRYILCLCTSNTIKYIAKNNAIKLRIGTRKWSVKNNDIVQNK